MSKHPICNERFPGESFEDYKERQRRNHRKLRARLKGMLFYASNDVEPGATSRSGRVPYRKADHAEVV